MSELSYYDERMAERAAHQRAAQDGQETHHNASEGFGAFLGMVLLIGSVLALPVTGGLSIVGIVAGCMLIAGGQVEKATLKALDEADDQAGRNSALVVGCTTVLIGGLATIVFVLLIAAVLNGGQL